MLTDFMMLAASVCSTAFLPILVNMNVLRQTPPIGEAVFSMRVARGGHQLFDTWLSELMANGGTSSLIRVIAVESQSYGTDKRAAM
jgi:hypothetical protein